MECFCACLGLVGFRCRRSISAAACWPHQEVSKPIIPQVDGLADVQAVFLAQLEKIELAPPVGAHFESDQGHSIVGQKAAETFTEQRQRRSLLAIYQVRAQNQVEASFLHLRRMFFRRCEQLVHIMLGVVGPKGGASHTSPAEV
eukprot:g3239.t1